MDTFIGASFWLQPHIHRRCTCFIYLKHGHSFLSDGYLVISSVMLILFLTHALAHVLLFQAEMIPVAAAFVRIIDQQQSSNRPEGMFHEWSSVFVSE